MNQEIIQKIILELESIISEAEALETYYQEVLEKIHPKWKQSALNLIHYRTLRKHDIREIQSALSMLGMSRLAKAEAHIMPSIKATIAILGKFLQPTALDLHKIPYKAIEQGTELLQQHTCDLLGNRHSKRKVKIMVTQPSETAINSDLVDKMISAGMDCARINCAHDSQEKWAKMIDNIKGVANNKNADIKICMDLAGPKIRTGRIKPGPEVIRFKVTKNKKGELIENAKIKLVDKQNPLDLLANELPVSQSFISQLKVGNKLHLVDTRYKKRTLKIVETASSYALLESNKSLYIASGTLLTLHQKKATIKATVKKLPALEQAIKLQVGDTLLLVNESIFGLSAEYDREGSLLRPAYISCTSPEVFKGLKQGESILFDDGKIEGVIKEVFAEEVVVKITQTPPEGGNLKADKGINFPHSNLKIDGLTQKDITDLDFVTQHTDIINLSFVNRPRDVNFLLAELQKRGPKPLGVILKIETTTGYNQLTDIMLTAMQHYPLGVMIARGDLAVECGWKNLGRIQEEILSLCHAAHIPLVWATQVLETLAKKGIPSRAELTDATMGQRTECIMLNKGPNITEAIAMLSEILEDMHAYQNKKAAMLPPIVDAV